MDIHELCKEMERINEEWKDDKETIHGKIDKLLLKYINNPRVTELFEAVEKWYA